MEGVGDDGRWGQIGNQYGAHTDWCTERQYLRLFSIRNYRKSVLA